MRLMPNESLIHDIVTSVHHRGKCVGPFMIGRMASVLLNELRVNNIIVDVNVRNISSLRMMGKVGLRAHEKVLYLTLAGNLAFQTTLKAYG